MILRDFIKRSFCGYPSMNKDRNWDILLIGGASGSGKTSISRPLARFYCVDFVRVDDFQVLLETMTTPESLPSIHYWKTHPDWMKEGVNAAVDQLVDVGKALIPGLTAVINDHLEEDIPMILEGDFILPELPASFTDARVKSFFVHEPEREQILKNYLAREGELQQYRSDVSHAYGNWLAKSCSKHGIPIVESRPWSTLAERAKLVLK